MAQTRDLFKLKRLLIQCLQQNTHNIEKEIKEDIKTIIDRIDGKLNDVPTQFDVVGMLNNTFKTKQTHPRTEFSKPSIYIWGIEHILLDVFTNLFSNANKYGNNAKIITAKVINGYVQITIDDNGPGIPASEQSMVFNRGFRGRIAKNKEGNGFGLYSVKKGIIIHHGKINLKNLHPGLRIIIELPLHNKNMYHPNIQKDLEVFVHNLGNSLQVLCMKYKNFHKSFTQLNSPANHPYTSQIGY